MGRRVDGSGKPAGVSSVGFLYALSVRCMPSDACRPMHAQSDPPADRAADPAIVPMLDGCGW
jgi:hypothetical protein